MNESKWNSCDRNETVVGQTLQLSTLGYIFPISILSVFICFGNILVLLALYKFQELRTSLNVYVVGLALTDLAAGLIAIPIYVAVYVFPVINNVFFICMLPPSIVIITSGSSSILLVVISIDRYLAIEKPFQYDRIMTTGKAKGVSVGILLFTLSYSSLPILGWNKWSPCVECYFELVLPRLYMSITVGVNFFSIIFVGILNMKIFLTANKTSRKIQVRMSNWSEEASRVKVTGLVKNKRAFKVLLVMFSAFTICICPFGVSVLLRVLDKKVPRDVHVGATVLFLISSCINPVIYHRRIPEFNRAFRKLLGMKEKVSPINPASPHPMRSTNLK